MPPVKNRARHSPPLRRAKSTRCAGAAAICTSLATVWSLAFVWGLCAGVYQIFPYSQLQSVKNALDQTEGTPANPTYTGNPKIAEIAAGMEQWGRSAEIVMVGDSITAQGQWAEMFPDIAILNRGIGGDTAGGVADRADLLLRSQPKAFFLMIGVNDLFYPGNSNEQIFGEMDRAISKLGAGGAQVFVQSIMICNRTNPVCTPARQRRLEQFNAELSIMAARHGAHYIDLNSVMAGPDGLIAEFTWDGLHLNGRGYAAWRSILAPHITAAAGERAIAQLQP